ncbi:hypothetical protein AAC387_Pa09g2194 [Persea americana]
MGNCIPVKNSKEKEVMKEDPDAQIMRIRKQPQNNSSLSSEESKGCLTPKESMNYLSNSIPKEERVEKERVTEEDPVVQIMHVIEQLENNALSSQESNLAPQESIDYSSNSIPTEEREEKEKVMEEDLDAQIMLIIEQLENNSLSSKEFKGCLTLQESIYKSINQQAYETGQSSKAHPIPTQDCPICMEPKHPHETFAVQGCFHVFCLDCIRGHITAKTQENITKVRCPQPDCERELEIELCGLILPPELLARWGNLLCESTILEPTKFYCPFKDCSALLLADDGIAVTMSECPHCSRVFCARCKVPWHTCIGCEEFQKLRVGDREREDIMVVNLAKEKKWQKCPSCGFIVERTAGCNYIKCRCKYCFCYKCGAEMNRGSHRCSKCDE